MNNTNLKGVDNITGGYSIANNYAAETLIARNRKRLSLLFKAKNHDSILKTRNAYIQGLNIVIFQNRAKTTADFRHDPSRSRQINQTRNFTNKAPIY
jgi:hypothetical protein